MIGIWSPGADTGMHEMAASVTPSDESMLTKKETQRAELCIYVLRHIFGCEHHRFMQVCTAQLKIVYLAIFIYIVCACLKNLKIVS